MKLNEMLSNFPDRDQRNEKLVQMVFSHITPPMIVELMQHGIEPHAFASGINFVLQHLAQNGMPEDWEEVVHPVDPDPAKNSEVALTKEDGPALAIEAADFFGQWNPPTAEGPRPPLPSHDPMEGSGF